MDMTTLGVASVAAITVICYLVGIGAKLLPVVNDKAIPVICGLSGCLVGLLWFFGGWGDYPATDPVTAAAVGIVSGLAATGVNQVIKQFKGE